MITEYRKWWDSVKSLNNQHETFIKWFSEHKDGLPSITSMISVGAGDGELDSEIIRKSLIGLQCYIGVEPDSNQRDTLSGTMITKCPNVKLQVVPEPIGEWQGPSEPVDLVLAVSVLYYIPDRVAAIQQMYRWVRPGGVLIICHAHDDFLYSNVAMEAGLNVDYWMTHLREDLKRVGFDDFKEYKVAYSYDMGSTFNEEMMRYYYKHNMFQGTASDEDVQRCVDISRKRFEISDRHQISHNGIVLLEKLD